MIMKTDNNEDRNDDDDYVDDDKHEFHAEEFVMDVQIQLWNVLREQLTNR